VEFGLLGPVQARVAGRPVDLGGPRQRALLALLLLHLNEPLSVDSIVDALWGETMPTSATKMVHLYISRLRKALEREGVANVILTRPGGYVLELEPRALDLKRFEQLVQEARRGLPAQPERAAAGLREALSLWRGPALADLSREEFAAIESARLEEERLAATEDFVDAELALGRHAELASRLEALVATHPTRERLRGQLILALYRSGRQAEALATYRATRATLVEELGIEPSKTLQELHEAILRQDAALELSPSPHTSTTPAPAAAVPASGRRRRTVAVGAALAGAAALVGSVALVARSSGAKVRLKPNSVAVLDPASGSILSDIGVGKNPGPIVAGSTGVWVGNRDDRTVVELNAKHRLLVATYGLPHVPTDLAASGRFVWVSEGYSGTFSRIVDHPPSLSSPVRPIVGARGLVLLSASPSHLWVGLMDRSLLELDPNSLRVTTSLRGSLLPGTILLVGGFLWESGKGQHDLFRINLRTGKRDRHVRLGNVTALAAGRGALWVATPDRVWRIDPATGRIEGSAPAPDIESIAVSSRWVWAASAGTGLLYQFDDAPTLQLVRTRQLGRRLGDITLSDNKLWVALD
jgi:DNA-binding SARP family transcriptional activator